MGDYLKLFSTDAERLTYEDGETYIEPYVSYVEGDNSVHYNKPPFFCKLTLSDDSVVEIEGSGELTSAMTQPYIATCVSAEIGGLCTSIGNRVFYKMGVGNGVLTSVTIPNTVTSIGDSAFDFCYNLTSITIPSSVTSIGDYVFYNCRNLANITVDSNNTTYDSRNNCNAIIETATNTLLFGCNGTIIPNTVTKIHEYAFYCYYGLTSVTIPNSVTTIGGRAFYECNNLTSVTVEATTPPTLGDYAFESTSLYNIYVPSISVDTYKATSGWYDYASYIQAIPTT